MQVLSETVRNYYIWQWLLLLLLLIPTAIQDIKEKNVSVFITIAGLSASILINIVLEPNNILKVFICAIPGTFLLICAWITNEAIGYGDGMVLLGVGNIIGLKEGTESLFIALLIAGIFSCVLMIIKRANRATTVPFIPFLLIGVLSIGVI